MSSLDVFVGIDLGSTTTKAVVLQDDGSVIGRGITNSRSNYEVACGIARQEAVIDARFHLTRAALERVMARERAAAVLPALARSFRLEQHLAQLERLRAALHDAASAPRCREMAARLHDLLDVIVEGMRERAPGHFEGLMARKSDFFRDLAAADYMSVAQQHADPKGISFDVLASLFDAAILPVENAPLDDVFDTHIGSALGRVLERRGRDLAAAASIRNAVDAVRAIEMVARSTVGTGYGRQRLPFPKEQIRSEILCHGLGAHAMFGATRTVLDIGGQDTKAIQVDDRGIVTSFQMNDRCAAGCGRYLGYIADEMNLGLHELGPLAQQSRVRVKINSTCTVFAGAELRERLSLGQRREDILAGLHRAIILRAMSLLARSGGVSDEFTFTGGVARNPAAVAALTGLVEENYGKRTINISPDSIYTGALGAALFVHRAVSNAA